jgi:hypothetical protein
MAESRPRKRIPLFLLLLGSALLGAALVGLGVYLARRTPQASVTTGDTTNADRITAIPTKHEEAKERVIKGQVFLVLKNRQTIKLSLVEIRLLDAHSSGETFNRERAEAASRLAVLRPKRVALSSGVAELTQAVSRYADGDIAQKKLVAIFNERTQIATATIRDPSMPEWFKQDARKDLTSIRADVAKNADTERLRLSLKTRTVTLLQQAEAELKAVSVEIRRLENPETYLSRFSGDVLARATTDTDGRFSIVLPAGERFLLAASVSRMTGGEEETFGWLVPVSPENPGEVVLSNQNLFGPPE